MQPTRRGRPPGTSARALEAIALRLFAEQGYDETTIDQIAGAAGVSKRTFFRYFDAKSDVLWAAFDDEVTNLRRILDEMPEDVSVMEGVRRAVLEANRYRPAYAPELRSRMTLVSTVPELAASASVHYDAWERAVADYAARRCGQPADSLVPLTVARTTLAACRAAYERWLARADADLTVYLDAALRALLAGLADDTLVDEPRPVG